MHLRPRPLASHSDPAPLRRSSPPTWGRRVASLVLAVALPATALALTATGEQKLVPPSASGGDEAGWSVALDGGTAVLGAPQDDTLGASSGAVHVYGNATGVLAPVATLTVFGGTVKKDGSDGERFLAVNAPAPEICAAP